MFQSSPRYESPPRLSPQIKEKGTRKTRICNIWQFDSYFDTELEAINFIQSKGPFSFYYGGIKTFNKVYRCTQVTARASDQCDEKYRIVLPNESSKMFKVEWNKNSCEENLEKRKNVINQECKDYIQSIYNAGVRGPKKMIS